MRDPGAAWGARLVTRGYTAGAETSDPGEAAALARLGPALDGARVLDVGVGVGRTTALLAPRAGHYVGIDVAPRMVEQARAAHPGVDLRVGDARDLRPVAADASFDLAVFSLNGIDAVDHAERARVVAELRRVLVPGGRVLVSTHSLDAPGTLGAPSLRHALRRNGNGSVPVRAARPAYRLGMHAVSLRYWRRRPADLPRGDGWAMWPLPAHEFRFVCHRIRFSTWVAQLRATGLEPEAAWTRDGEPLALDAERTTAVYVHVLALAAA